MKKLQSIIISIMALVGVLALPVAPAFAAQNCNSPVECAQIGVNGIGDGKTGDQDFKEKLKIVVNVLLFILGAIAVIMIIIGGIKYTTSNGEASSIKSAKDTILYSVIGLIVAVLAYAIVNFVLNAFK